ncbi:putative 11-beta-hydroxysteroid dehydrogenase [Helianthus annuus]|nr:putative 11-beta-hydroxysteroid dehydrogenase [Helianthus annuus]KAJ0811930.1 putative 11-beta-hydroxysteroid dehydrogenase [Helianthus annuus]
MRLCFLSFLLLVSPLLFFWELIHTVRSCFRCSKNMSGKVVLITGAVLMAYEYAKRSAYLAIIAIKEPDSLLEQVADRARARGSPDVLSVFADVSKFDECRVFVDDTVKHFGHCRTNFWGSVYPTHCVIPHLMKTKGKIVVNASSAGVLHPPNGGLFTWLTLV